MKSNPYELLVEIAGYLTDVDMLKAEDESVRMSVLEQNASTVESARAILGPDVAVPKDRFLVEHVDGFDHLRNMARFFRAEAVSATFQDDFHTAAKCALDIFELSNAVRRGGLILDLLCSNAYAAIGLVAFAEIRTKLSEQTRRFVISELDRLEKQREPFADILERDQQCDDSIENCDEPLDFISDGIENPDECGVPETIQAAVNQGLQKMADMPAEDLRELERNQDNQALALMRLLSVDLAVRSFRDSQGIFPGDLSGLLPAHFLKVPLDPFTERSLVYQLY